MTATHIGFPLARGRVSTPKPEATTMHTTETVSPMKIASFANLQTTPGVS
jgi:hypothetical protein